MSTAYQDHVGPPGPASAPQGDLPYPYVTQYDPQQQATYYANTETGETYWDLPEQARKGIGASPSVQGGGLVHSRPDSFGRPPQAAQGYGAGDGHPTPAVQGERTKGEAASFYGSGGPPQNSNQGSLGTEGHQEASSAGTRAFGSANDEQAQFGKTLGASGVAAMAWKMYKDYKNGKHNKQQFRPPSGKPSGFGLGGGSSMFGGGLGGPSMFSSGGVVGGHGYENHQYGLGYSNQQHGHSYGGQQQGHHGPPDARISTGGGGFLSSLLDGGGRPHGGPGFDSVLGGGGMQSRPGHDGYGNQRHHAYGSGVREASAALGVSVHLEVEGDLEDGKASDLKQSAVASRPVSVAQNQVIVWLGI